MNNIGNFVIIVLGLAVLAVIVIVALMKRAKNDPESLKHMILEHAHIPDDADDMYDIVVRFDSARDRVSRSARPKYPDSNDYREWMAAMEERGRRVQEEMQKQNLEDLEMW